MIDITTQILLKAMIEVGIFLFGITWLRDGIDLYSIKRIFFLFVGSISLALGVIGIFLPLLPTTPLLLLAVACYLRSSEKLYDWLINHKYLGPFINNWRQGKGIPFKIKVTSIVFLWISMMFSVIFIHYIILKMIFFIIPLFFTWFILKQKTLPQQHKINPE
jgi:uncharacterized protein